MKLHHHQCDDGEEDYHHHNDHQSDDGEEVFHYHHHYHHHYHYHHDQCDDGEKDYSFGGPPPPQPHLDHSSYEPHPHMPSDFDRRSDENGVPYNLAGLAGRDTVKVNSKAEPNYYLTIRDGKVILAPADASNEAQHWFKDERYSTRVKDAEGHPCFALVNKATGEAMKHSVGATHPLQVHLIRYDPDRLDESLLWTESKDLGDGYRAIRMINNTRLNVDAYHGDSKSGGVRDGTTIVLWD